MNYERPDYSEIMEHAHRKTEDAIVYSPERAISVAALWRAGKMIGGDEDAVRNALLDLVIEQTEEIERLQAICRDMTNERGMVCDCNISDETWERCRAVGKEAGEKIAGPEATIEEVGTRLAERAAAAAGADATFHVPFVSNAQNRAPIANPRWWEK